MKIVITGNYGAGNIGDELILEGLLNSVEACAPKAEITVLKGDEKFPSGVRSVFKYVFSSEKKSKKAVKRCDYFILGGGGLFGELSLKANVIWGMQALMAYYYKKPVIMYGQSIGEIKGRVSKWLVKKIFQKAELITVRDEASKGRLKLLGITKHITVIPDLAFNILYQPHNRKKKTLLLALRQKSSITKKFITRISSFLNDMIDDHWEIKVINFQDKPSKDADSIIHDKIISKITKKNHINIAPKPNTAEELFELYSTVSLVVGMRLHSIITAIKTERPFIALSYATKVKDLLKDASLEPYVLNAENIDSEIQLKKSAKLVLEKSHEISNDLHKISEQYFKKHKEIEKTILCKTFSNEH